MKRALAVGAVLGVVIGGINFFWLIAESSALGGDALNGHVADGHYFVCAHGACREVARDIWEWSRLHSISVWITHPLAMLGMAYLLFNYGFPMFMGTVATHANARVTLVEGSGPRKIRVRCGGLVGQVQMTAPLLSVSVYPAGIVLKPMLMSPFAILGTEIRRLTASRPFLSSRFEVEHAGIDTPSPTMLFVKARSAVALEITALAGGDDGNVSAIPLAPTTTDRQRRFETVTGVSNLILGAGGMIYGFLQLIPSAGVFGLFWMAVSAVFIVTGLVLLGVCLASMLMMVLQHFGRITLPGCGPGDVQPLLGGHLL